MSLSYIMHTHMRIFYLYDRHIDICVPVCVPLYLMISCVTYSFQTLDGRHCIRIEMKSFFFFLFQTLLGLYIDFKQIFCIPSS